MSIAGKQSGTVCFFANGAPRLVLAAALAGEEYRNHTKHLILLNQYGYCYDDVLPRVRSQFDRISEIALTQTHYSHQSQFYQTYLKSYRDVNKLISPGDNLVMFGIRSPLQKQLLKQIKRYGGEVDIYAESLAIERYFTPKSDDNIVVRLLRRLFAQAFSYQHDYDRFFVYFPDRYKASPEYEKLREMPDIFSKGEFMRLAKDFFSESAGLEQQLDSFDSCFFGQPLSNFDGLISKQVEVSMLRKILNDRKVLVLPHPNEVLGVDNKYSHLPNAKLLECDIPNDFILTQWRPARTFTYGSTIGLTYALHNPDSKNFFYPVFESQYHELNSYKQYLSNIEVSNEFIVRKKQY